MGILNPTVKLDEETIKRIDEILNLLKNKEIVITIREKRDD